MTSPKATNVAGYRTLVSAVSSVPEASADGTSDWVLLMSNCVGFSYSFVGSVSPSSSVICVPDLASIIWKPSRCYQGQPPGKINYKFEFETVFIYFQAVWNGNHFKLLGNKYKLYFVFRTNTHLYLICFEIRVTINLQKIKFSGKITLCIINFNLHYNFKHLYNFFNSTSHSKVNLITTEIKLKFV